MEGLAEKDKDSSGNLDDTDGVRGGCSGRVRVGSAFSNWIKVTSGVPQA